MSPISQEQALNEVAQSIKDQINEGVDGIFLYCEVEPGVIALGFYKEYEDHVECHLGERDLFKVIRSLWQLEPAGRRWGAMFYTIENGSFDARFQYPEEWSPDEDYDDRIARILKRKYGDKKIVYPEIG